MEWEWGVLFILILSLGGAVVQGFKSIENTLNHHFFELEDRLGGKELEDGLIDLLYPNALKRSTEGLEWMAEEKRDSEYPPPSMYTIEEGLSSTEGCLIDDNIIHDYFDGIQSSLDKIVDVLNSPNRTK